MASYLDKFDVATGMTRRNFVKVGASMAALVGAAGVAGCSNAVQETDSAGDAAQDGSPQATSASMAAEEGAEWIPAACWHNCGGRCLNKVLVKDGIVLRQKTDDTHEDSPDYPQQRGCLRGRSQRKHVFSADRLKYPMKRKSWSPDNPNGDLRGKDEWERISWDEALEYVAEGLKSAKEKYGNRSIMIEGGDESDNCSMARPLGLFGGYVETWNTNSFGGWIRTPFWIGFNHDGIWDQTVNDRYDLRESETIVMMSINPSWSALGSQTWNYWQAKQAGAKFICLDPFYNDTHALLDAKWLPVRPATDTAFLLAVAYAMLEQDDEKHLIDWDFLNNCTVGFDAEHMPKDAKEQTNFKDYVQGAYDNTPKTPEWAEPICGVPAQDIRDLAVEMGKDKKVAFLCGMASARTHNADNLPQLVMAVGAMGGHMGKSGHMCGSTMHCTSGNGGPALIMRGSDGYEAIPNPVDDAINANELYDAILNGSYNWTGAGAIYFDTQAQPGEKRDIDIHVVYHARAAGLQTDDSQKKGIEAMRAVDMVVTHAHFFTTNARYSDIVLPVTTEWEKFGGFSGGGLVHSSNREMMIAYRQITEPLYEAKSDGWIALEVGKRLGLKEEDIYPFGDEQAYYNQLASMQKLDEDGKTTINAVEITQEDIDEMGVEGEPQEGAMPYQELKEKGVYQVERSKDDNYGYIAFEDFVKDPEKNPLDTASGKLEIYSQTLADTVNAMGFSKITPIPTWIPPIDGYQDTFANWDTQEKGEFPLQIINIKYPRRAHTVFDNVPWLREAWVNPVYLSQQDADDAGIADGDTVLISAPTGGQTLRPASITGRLRPGVVALPHGAWVDVDEETGIDRAGSDNYLTNGVATGCGISGFNSNICKIEKYSGTPLEADVDLPARIPLKEGE